METASACQVAPLHQDVDEAIVITQGRGQRGESSRREAECFLDARWTDQHPTEHNHEPLKPFTQVNIWFTTGSKRERR